MENPRRSSVGKLREIYERKSVTDKRASKGKFYFKKNFLRCEQ